MTSKTLCAKKNEIYEFVRAKCDYVAKKPEELTFKKGDLMKIVSREPKQPGFWTGNRFGVIGLFPVTLTQYVDLKKEMVALNQINCSPSSVSIAMSCSPSSCSPGGAGGGGGGGGQQRSRFHKKDDLFRDANGKLPALPDPADLDTMAKEEPLTLDIQLPSGGSKDDLAQTIRQLESEMQRVATTTAERFNRYTIRAKAMRDLINHYQSMVENLAEGVTSHLESQFHTNRLLYDHVTQMGEFTKNKK